MDTEILNNNIPKYDPIKYVRRPRNYSQTVRDI